MEEEKINKELEKLIEEINKNFEGRIYSGKDPEEELLLKIHHEMKYVEFIGAYKRKANNMSELGPLFEYMKKNGYTSNLEKL
jgi:chorismate mutase